MSRILFAWELGANYGHLMQLAMVGESLRAAGHQVLFAVRDLKGAAEVLGSKGFALAQAPLFQRHRRATAAPANHAEMLALEGYADEASTWGRVGGWISLARLLRADAIVADHSPGALIAGRILKLPQVQIGTGFEIPPQCSPMPCIRPWENIPEERLRRSEQQVAGLINRVLRSFRGSEIANLAELFATEARIFTTFVELDPFGPRTGERYVGPIFQNRFGESATWPKSGRPRVFAYLRNEVAGAQNILRALKTIEADTICVFPDVRPGMLKELASDRLRITTRPLQLDSVLPQADLALLYGGHGVVAAALAAGVPILVVPQNVEQYLHARCLEAAGVGAVMKEMGDSAAATARIEQVLQDRDLRSKAREFSARYAGFDPARAVEEAATIIGNIAGNSMAGAARPTAVDSGI